MQITLNPEIKFFLKILVFNFFYSSYDYFFCNLLLQMKVLKEYIETVLIAKLLYNLKYPSVHYNGIEDK